MFAPDLDVRLHATVEIIGRRHGAETTAIEAHRHDGGILDVDRFPADDAGKARHRFNAQAGDIHGQVEPEDAEPGEMTAAATGTVALPGRPIRFLSQTGLI